MRRSFIPVLSLLILSVGSIHIAGQRVQRRLPYQYVIPSGYVGWIRVEFNVKDAPPLSIENKRYVLRIPATGHFQTSTEYVSEPADFYLYECGSIRERLVISRGDEACRIWGDFAGPATLSDATPHPFRYFFVGLKEQYQKYQFSGENLPNLELEKDGYPRVGSKVALPPCDDKSPDYLE